MEHINIIQRKIKEISLNNPRCSAINGLESFMKKRRITNYYLGLDEFTYVLGLTFKSVEVIDKNEQTIGYRPYLKYYPKNVFGYENEWEALRSSPFPKEKDCYQYLIKELIYKLRTLGETKLAKFSLENY